MKNLKILFLMLFLSTAVLISCESGGINSGAESDEIDTGWIAIDDTAPTGDTESATSTDIVSTAADYTTAPSGTQQPSPLPGGRTTLLPDTEENTGENFEVTWSDKIKIASPYENDEKLIYICANVWKPKNIEGKLPLIIMSSSWALNEYEYMPVAEHLAKKGYIVLSYTHRGWWGTDGEASLGGEADWVDFSNVLDWAIANLPVDTENIGVSGVSLGGGASLDQISKDPRIKTCAAISPYIDMYRSMYSQNTPRLFWGIVLCGTAALLSNADSDIFKVWTATLKHINLDWLYNFMHGKSPSDFVDQLNVKNKPVYIATQFEDHMFQPDTALDYFNALTVSHKRLDLCLGTHFSGEMTGMLGFKNNYTYNNVDKWFDYWLKGIDTGIIPDTTTSAVITMEDKNTPGKRSVYDMADLSLVNGIYSWPIKNLKSETFYCEPKGTIKNGTLSYTPGTEKGINAIYSSTLTYTVDFVLQQTQAGGMVGPILEQFNMPLIRHLSTFDRSTTIIYEGPVYTTTRKIRGTAHATLRMSLSRSNGQVLMYLYDVNENGYATFITHGFRTFYDWEFTSTGLSKVRNVIDIPLVATAYDIPAGHHLALVIDTGDFNYCRPDGLPFMLALHHGVNGQSSLTVPYEQ
ncbi:MAG: hypothetical protein GXY14_15990 [Spirochaetes bacterium]|nr:hypothetical protein [Spirochaetota bacterium]